MELGDSTTAERDQRSLMDTALDRFDSALTDPYRTGAHLGAGRVALPLPPHPLPAKGWSCRINADGLPEWIPPRWIDQDQRPHINPRIWRLHAQRRLDRHNRRQRTLTVA